MLTCFFLVIFILSAIDIDMVTVAAEKSSASEIGNEANKAMYYSNYSKANYKQ
ncbi:MAG: hypothetical protein II984_09465 [Clostridia bacterium]|nr:hypothetical protein [Clostridia bacterium]